MRPDRDFTQFSKVFWANVRTVSEKGGYVVKGKKNVVGRGQIKVYSVDEICSVLDSLGLATDHIRTDGTATELGLSLAAYFRHRANILNAIVEPQLMRAEEAASEFKRIKTELGFTNTLPLNKQSGTKKTTAYLTGIVNMLVSAGVAGRPVNLNPLILTTVTHEGRPARTLSRRVDGCFPSPINPIAVWEIKEYYYTTTFGSRVADGVYETMLDGMELQELRENLNRHVDHVLIVDAHFTWWVKGRSYLCRIIDMLHMGYVSEVLFGRETVSRLPELIAEWVAIYDANIAGVA